MIGARVRVVNEDGSFTIVVYAESLREIEQTAKIRYPKSTVTNRLPDRARVVLRWRSPYRRSRRSRGNGRVDRPDKAIVT